MKTLGLLGGMSWESTALYYKIINTEVKQALGKLHSAQLLIYSFDFEDIAILQKAGKWHECTEKMVKAGNALKSAGAEALVICTNTMHLMADEVETATKLPVIHIADCTAEEIKNRKMKKVGLLGTQFTMEQPFYKQRLEEKFGIQVMVPQEEDRIIVHSVIYDELCKGVINPASYEQFQEIIGRLKERGAEGIILGCTEICLLVPEQKSMGLIMFDTTDIHARYAARYSLR
jgi:aspartate racemase